jgi:glycine cleavage system aminomethyltransferase T
MSVRYKALVAFVLVASCGTPEFQAERASCEAIWMQKIPPVYRQQVVTRTRYEQRPTGQVTCTTQGTTTNCNQVMTSVAIPYTAVETVDIYKAQRDVQVRACAVAACDKKYGNPECKPAG